MFVLCTVITLIMTSRSLAPTGNITIVKEQHPLDRKAMQRTSIGLLYLIEILNITSFVWCKRDALMS